MLDVGVIYRIGQRLRLVQICKTFDKKVVTDLLRCTMTGC